MKIHRSSSLLLATILSAFVAVALPAQEAKKKAAKPLSAERSVLVTVSAKIESLDAATRKVTLKGPLGNVTSFTVDQRVKRLEEFKVGDYVTADYFISVAGELRPPTEAEKAEPIQVIADGARAPKDTTPAGGALAAIKVVATVVGLDLPTMTVSLQGPAGNIGEVRAESVDNIKKLRLGETIVVTYTEALAISLEKTTAPKSK
jgi:Cu/Ag efflux protein CusF